jgi:hypothetical protein
VQERFADKSHSVEIAPMLILYAEKEQGQLGKQAEEFGESLKKEKVDATVAMIKDRNHATIALNIVKEGDPATKLILAFIEKNTK